MLLIIVDTYSKWLEVNPTYLTRALATMKLVDDLFAACRVPITVVSDNRPQFRAEKFEIFLKVNEIKYHKLTAPYHPYTNG